MASPYTAFSESELEDLRSTILDRIKLVLSGQDFITLSVGGKTVERRLPTLAELQSTLSQIDEALGIKNPTTYGRSINRTVIEFA